MHRRFLLPMFLLLACNGDDSDETDVPTDSDTDADTNVDTDEDTDSGVDTDGGDTQAPALPGTAGADYTWFFDGDGLNVYWRAASDDQTAAADLQYRVRCGYPDGGSDVTLDWTAASALPVEGSGRYWAVACSGGTGARDVTVSVRDAAGNQTDYPTLNGEIPAADSVAPTLPSTSHPDYTVFVDRSAMNIYWRNADDDVTASADLEYRVLCRPYAGTGWTAMNWTPGGDIATEASGRMWALACSDSSGTYDAWVEVRDEAGNVTEFPTLTATMVVGDEAAPTLPNTSGSDYTVFAINSELLIYWRAATDDVTAPSDLMYAVTCVTPMGSYTSMAWTDATALPVEGSGRFWAVACTGSGRYSAWVSVRDEAGNVTDYPSLGATLP